MSAEPIARRQEYQFGDCDVAADRLRLLAEVFEPSSREFLASLAITPRSIADLGCGPGNTTRMLAELFRAAQVTGVDSSEHFIDLARRVPAERVNFEVGDVTQALPGGPYDLIYCRYLLTHVAEAEATVDRWSAHLRPDGAIAIEENEWIETEQPAFTKYLRIVEGMLADSGQELYVGSKLHRATNSPNLVARARSVQQHSVSDRSAAGMFLPNLETWRTRSYIQRNYSTDELDRLHAELATLARDGDQRAAITFGLRRLVLERRG